MEKIRFCPEHGSNGYAREVIHCPKCGSKIEDRSPMVWVSVEVERNASEELPTTILDIITINELFDIAKDEGLIK